MKLKELKEYLLSLPERLDDFSIVNGELVVSENDEIDFVFVSNTVHTVYVDEKLKEIQVLHQSEEDIKNLMNGNT